ncbi:MAG: hypothetical protein WB384_23430 [Candidatus Sulfotelmatobacter sp.]
MSHGRWRSGTSISGPHGGTVSSQGVPVVNCHPKHFEVEPTFRPQPSGRLHRDQALDAVKVPPRGHLQVTQLQALDQAISALEAANATGRGWAQGKMKPRAKEA